MTWPTLSFSLHTAPIQNTTNLLFSYILLSLRALSLSKDQLGQPTAGAFPNQPEAKARVSQVMENILPVSRPVFASFLPPSCCSYSYNTKKTKAGEGA